MNILLWAGLGSGTLLLSWSLFSSGASGSFLNIHGLAVVIGGTLAASLISSPPWALSSAFARVWSLLMPASRPTPDTAVAEILRLARIAQSEGGLLSINNASPDFLEGFLQRAITVAIATGETTETRRIVEADIGHRRRNRQEDGNIFRTLGVLAPMFGILGTLLGMIQVLKNLSEPTKVGPAMALALSSAFIGISIANFICIPLAGQIRLVAMREALIQEILLEGILDITSGKPPYLIELHLSSYLKQRSAGPSEGPDTAATEADA